MILNSTILDTIDNNSDNSVFDNIESNLDAAYGRIAPYLQRTPILYCDKLNTLLGGHEVFFKADNLQVTGSFKVRGVLNSLLVRKENHCLPQKVIAYSSGNHGCAVAYVCNKLGLKSKIYMHNSIAESKLNLCLQYGAEVCLMESRYALEQAAYQEASTNKDWLILTPSGEMNTILGQATVAYEALQDVQRVDAIFVSVGGGGLFAGSYIAKNYLSPNTLLFGGEPLNANKAKRSLNMGQIFKFDEIQNTIADGARPLCLSPLAWPYIRDKGDGIYEISEEKIVQSVDTVNDFLNITCEPTAILSFAAAREWLDSLSCDKKLDKKRIVVILSGGNTNQSNNIQANQK